MLRAIVVSGAPGTGKSTAANHLSHALHLPELSLDFLKESLADVLGTGDEQWSDRLGDAAAEVVFRLSKNFDACVVEGWWRGQRRDRACLEFAGFVEVFCHCDPAVAADRFALRRDSGRHPIHRDVINPNLIERVADLAATVEPLGIGPLIRVDTTSSVDWPSLPTRVQDLM
ncbi:MAG: AAA family ATPase [Mycobacteriales bacterium]